MGNGGGDDMAETKNAAKAKTAAKSEAKTPAKLTWDEFHGLVKRAEKGDRECLPKLREALKSADYSDWSRWFRDSHGNPADWLKNSLAQMAGGKDDLALSEAVGMKMDHLRKELEGADPSPLERLLAERAIFCWFQVNVYEAIFSQPQEITLRQGEYRLRKIDSAHRRFLAAVATLARVRKLALPALQVNIGTNQVNMAQAGG
jgi:hypothetical protein